MIFDLNILVKRFLTLVGNSVSTVNCGSFANLDQWGSVPHSLGMWGLIVWLYHTVSLSPLRIAFCDPFSVFSEHFNMSSKRNEYKVHDRAEKAARFFVACKANAGTRLSIHAAMRAKGFGC
jgi:hypothetical protein